MIYFCCEQLRRRQVRNKGLLNGIDYLEVLDHDAPTSAQRQRKLLVYFINDKLLSQLTADDIEIEGGQRIRDVQVTQVSVDPDLSHVLVVEVDQPGDFSTYTLRLKDADPAQFDPMLSAIRFSFKVQCPSDFDCQTLSICPAESLQEPDIDYLARDFASLKQLLLDRMSQLMPQWNERSPADIGIALVELLAYVGDHLSYQQDAIGTEAYLGTSRRRISVRRHARLVDYFMHDGCNARTWVHVEVDDDSDDDSDYAVIEAGTQFLAGTAEHEETTIEPASLDHERAMSGRPVVFEPLFEKDGSHAETHGNITLFRAHNEIHFYTWSDQECCLPNGAVSATLKGSYTHLHVGDVVIFEEVLGPRTGNKSDADPTHRHAVRLTRVQANDNDIPLIDPQTAPILETDPPAQEITEIGWSTEDALPFPLCVSAKTDEGEYKPNVSVARGNMVLVDHGMTISDESLGTVPPPIRFQRTIATDRCQPVESEPVHARFRPQLEHGPLTQAANYDPSASASAALDWPIRDVNPSITLQRNLQPAQENESPTDDDEELWQARRDLLNSSAFDLPFVVEIENDGIAQIRFGDDQHGLRPNSGDHFTAAYRVGNGRSGNVGADSVNRIVTGEKGIKAVRNLLPAKGGLDPEPIEQVRRAAPVAFRTQQRAVTVDDYAEVTQRSAEVQKAAATFRWTGSWHTVFVTADRIGGLAVDDDFEARIRQHVERYRMAGYDMEVDGPRYVPLEIELKVCVKPAYFRSNVQLALLDIFHRHDLPDGRRGVFHPDNFSFGQPVYLSPIYAAAHSVDGVASVEVSKFGRQGSSDPAAINDGKLELERLEIARLDNDRNFPERGVFRMIMMGGK